MTENYLIGEINEGSFCNPQDRFIAVVMVPVDQSKSYRRFDSNVVIQNNQYYISYKIIYKIIHYKLITTLRKRVHILL